MAVGAGGIRAGKAFVEIGAKPNLAPGMRAAMAQLKSFSIGFAKIGASLAATGVGASVAGMGVGFGAAVLAMKDFINTGSDLTDMAGRTGASIEFLSEMSYAADQTGASMADLEVALKQLSRTFGGSTEDAFEKAAYTILAIEDPLKRVAKARELFGKSGTSLLPLLEEMSALRQEAKDFGLVFSREDAARADAFGDSLGLLWRTIRMGGMSLVSDLTPALTAASRALATGSKWLRNFVQELRLSESGWGSFVNTLMAGDLQLLFEQAWAGAKVAWFTGLDAIVGLINDKAPKIITTVFDIGDSLVQAFASTWNKIAEIVNRLPNMVVDPMEQAALGVVALMRQIALSVSSTVAKALDAIGNLPLHGGFKDLADKLRLESQTAIEEATNDAAQRIIGAAKEARGKPLLDQIEIGPLDRPEFNPIEGFAEEIAKAKRELDEALAKAPKPWDVMFAGGPNWKDRFADGASEALTKAENKAEASGTFGAGVAKLIGASGTNVQDKMAKGIEGIEGGVGELVAMGRRGGGMQFA